MLLLTVLALLLALAAIYWLVKHPRIAVVVCVLTFGAAVVGFRSFKSWERQLQLSYVPQSMGVSRVLYENEKSWGFGPGGNETGVIVYELPDVVAIGLKNSGTAYLTNLPGNSGDSHDWHGRYEKWQETPIPPEPDWTYKGSERRAGPTTPPPKLANYLDKYGFGIAIDSAIEREINEAISRPGNYFAYGRIGVLILIPDARKAVYAYNG